MKTTGVASDHKDLLSKIHTFATTGGWSILRFKQDDELIIKGPVVTGSKQPILIFKITSTYHCIGLRASTEFNTGRDYDKQPDGSPEAYLTLWDQKIKYWLFINNRRLIIIAKTGTAYQSSYSGFFAPYALPKEYPYPLCVIGGYATPERYNYDDAAHRMCIDPGWKSAVYRARSTATWQYFYNHDKSFGKSRNSSENSAFTWPCRTGTGSYDATGNRKFDTITMYNFIPTHEGVLPMFNVHIVTQDEHEFVGTLDGLFWPAGFGRSSEQTTTIDGVSYIFFQNISRITSIDYLAVADE